MLHRRVSDQTYQQGGDYMLKEQLLELILLFCHLFRKILDKDKEYAIFILFLSK